MQDILFALAMLMKYGDLINWLDPLIYGKVLDEDPFHGLYF